MFISFWFEGVSYSFLFTSRQKNGIWWGRVKSIFFGEGRLSLSRNSHRQILVIPPKTPVLLVTHKTGNHLNIMTKSLYLYKGVHFQGSVANKTGQCQVGESPAQIFCTDLFISSFLLLVVVLNNTVGHWLLCPFSLWGRKYIVCISSSTNAGSFHLIVLFQTVLLCVCVFSAMSLNHPLPEIMEWVVQIFPWN